MRPRTKTPPVHEQAQSVLRAITELGGISVTFRAISSLLGTEDLTMFRQGLNALLAENKIEQHGVKRAACYSIIGTPCQDIVPPFREDIRNTEDSSVRVDRTEIPESTLMTISPEDYLVDLVKNNVGYSNEELAQFLQAKYPGTLLEQFERIKSAVKQKKISFVPENRPSNPGNRCYFYSYSGE